MEVTTLDFDLPGFRFHPTEEELVDFYLKNIVYGRKMRFDVIGLLNIYRHNPWELPGLANIDGGREWYFFVSRDRKQSNGGRPNRTTQNGYWKATGSDRKVITISEPKRFIGWRKTLVFYGGRAPQGSKTDWVMNEYRLIDNFASLRDIVLCKIYRKATPLKVLEQRATTDEETKSVNRGSYPTSPLSSNGAAASSHYAHQEDLVLPMPTSHGASDERGWKFEETVHRDISVAPACTALPVGEEILPELLVPKSDVDWTLEDPFRTQWFSPWLECLTPCATIL
ncbi:hypothetical protein Nepgr_018179 [Nepenthes gracilis]|uniref:NAC domain-containing protein n=1 Tax=Nepenthes gracilis TaxID=150966 RepID=A0AAD3SQT8_NEPGR|nr:hypothetical protein Nepgr_018179 [Nepenthes gracilis]